MNDAQNAAAARARRPRSPRVHPGRLLPGRDLLGRLRRARCPRSSRRSSRRRGGGGRRTRTPLPGRRARGARGGCEGEGAGWNPRATSSSRACSPACPGGGAGATEGAAGGDACDPRSTPPRTRGTPRAHDGGPWRARGFRKPLKRGASTTPKGLCSGGERPAPSRRRRPTRRPRVGRHARVPRRPAHLLAQGRLLRSLRSRDAARGVRRDWGGKTTQVPQYLLDDAIDAGVGAGCRVICTRPGASRSPSPSASPRNGASGTASGAAGAFVGHHVRLDAAVTRDTRLVFMTAGVLLQARCTATRS